MRGLIAIPSHPDSDFWPSSAAFVAGDADISDLIEAEGTHVAIELVEIREWPNTCGQVLLHWEADGPNDDADIEAGISFPGRCRLLTPDEWALVVAGRAQEVVT